VENALLEEGLDRARAGGTATAPRGDSVLSFQRPTVLFPSVFPLPTLKTNKTKHLPIRLMHRRGVDNPVADMLSRHPVFTLLRRSGRRRKRRGERPSGAAGDGTAGGAGAAGPSIAPTVPFAVPTAATQRSLAGAGGPPSTSTPAPPTGTGGASPPTATTPSAHPSIDRAAATRRRAQRKVTRAPPSAGARQPSTAVEGDGDTLANADVPRRWVNHMAGDLREDIKQALLLDPARPMSAYEESDGLVYQTGADGGCRVWVPPVERLRLRVMQLVHDEREGASHFGAVRTLELLRRLFTWEGVEKDVVAFVKSCHACQVNEPRTRLAPGRPAEYPTPTRAFAAVHIDFFFCPKLMRKSVAYDAVLLVVCRLSKFLYCIPCSITITGAEAADLLFKHVFAIHGAPEYVVSDRDPRFRGAMFRSIMERFNMQLRCTTSYRPQGNGQAERSVRTVKTALRKLVLPDGSDWIAHLPFVTFSYNNTVARSHGMTPYYVVYGHHPVTPLEYSFGRRAPLASDERNTDGDPLTAELLDAVEHTHALGEIARCAADAVKAARYEAMVREGRARDPGVVCQVGEEVLLDARNITLLAQNSLSPKFILCRIERFVSPTTVALRLPPEHHQVHNVFNIELLKKYFGDASFFEERVRANRQPMPMLGKDGEVVWGLDRITARRRMRKADGSFASNGRRPAYEYQCVWDFYDPADVGKWFSATTLGTGTQVRRMIRAFDAECDEKERHARAARGDDDAGGDAAGAPPPTRARVR